MEQPTPTQQPQPMPGQTGPVQTGKSSDPFKVWAIVLGILFLAAAGFAAWQTIQASSLNSRVGELETTNSQLSKTITELTEPGDSQDGDTPTDSDTSKILAATDAYTRAPAGITATYEYEVLEKTDEFARVSASTGSGGGAVILKKVGDNWTVVHSSSDMPDQATIDKYGIPESILQ